MHTPALPDSHAARAHDYQRQRLWCGIVGIALILNFLWFGTFLGLTRLPALLPAWPVPVVCGLTALCLGLAVTALQLPVDLYAQRVERRFDQTLDRATVRRAYLMRSLEWLVGLTVAGGVLGVALVFFGPHWPWAGGLLLVALGFAHVALPLMPARVRPLTPDEAVWLDAVRAELAVVGQALVPVKFYDHGERSLAGGWHGVGPLRVLVLSTTLTTTPPRLAAGLILRELGHLSYRHRLISGVCTVGWTVGGFVIAGLMMPGWAVADSPAGAVVWVTMIVSTWSWLGLFVWPALGRRQTYQADAFAARYLGTADARAMLDLLAARNLPDESLPPVIAWVFHPIPPMRDRRAALAGLISGAPVVPAVPMIPGATS